MFNLPLKNKLYGNEEFISKIETMICYNSINSFLVGGAIGLGKANFVYKFSKFLLSHFEQSSKLNLRNTESNFYNTIIDNRSSHLFDNNTHPDFINITLNRDIDEKKIPIDKIRNLNIFFKKTYSISHVKIAVINTIEDLSVNSLNLLLKTIEELSADNYIFLISHKPMNVLKTITSRCTVLNMKILNNKDYEIFVKENIKNISKDENSFIKDISSNSPGFAKSLYEKKILNLYVELLDDLLASKKYLNIREAILKLFVSQNKQASYYLYVINIIINNLIKNTCFYLLENKYLGIASSKEKELIHLISSKNNILNLLNLHSNFDKDMYTADLLNLNKSDIINNMFKDLCGF